MEKHYYPKVIWGSSMQKSMRFRSSIYIALIWVLICSCEKEETEPCPTVQEEVDYKGNRVAFDLELRLGTWANIREDISTIDTIIFHNDSVWSNYYFNTETGKREGILRKKYQFSGAQLVFFDGYDGKPFDKPLHKYCEYSESTGLFSIFSNGFEHEDVYRKID